MRAGGASKSKPPQIAAVAHSWTRRRFTNRTRRAWSASFIGTSLALRPRATVFPSSSTSLSSAAAHFGVPSTDTLEAIRLCARLEGMLTDPVYEGKSMQALIDMVARGDFEPGSAVLYVHLGGVPAMSAYSYPFRNG